MAPFLLVSPGFISSSKYKEAAPTETKLKSLRAIKNMNHSLRLRALTPNSHLASEYIITVFSKNTG